MAEDAVFVRMNGNYLTTSESGTTANLDALEFARPAVLHRAGVEISHLATGVNFRLPSDSESLA